jgi:hypothetical protein
MKTISNDSKTPTDIGVLGKIATDMRETDVRVSFMNKFRQSSGAFNIDFSVFIYTIFVLVVALIVYGFVSFYSTFEDCKEKENTLGPDTECSVSTPCFYENSAKKSCDSCSLGYVLNESRNGYVCRSSEQHVDALSVTTGCFPDTDGTRQYQLTIKVLDSTNTTTVSDLSVSITDTEFINGDGIVSDGSAKVLPPEGFDLFQYIDADVETFVKRCAFTINIKLPTETTKRIVSVTHTGMRITSSSLQENDDVPPREVTVVSAPKSGAGAGTLTISLAPSTTPSSN